MAARGDFTVAMVLEALDQASKPIQDVQNKLKGLDRAAARVGSKSPFTRLFADLKGVGLAVRNVGSELAALPGRLAMLGLGLGALAYGFKTQFVDTAAEFERLRMSLEVVMGSAEKGRQTFDWLLQFAAKTPVTTATATQAFLLLKNAGIDPLSGSLQALVDYNARVGGSQENLTEITRQLGQAWMKSKLQMEEVNVLTERMIPVIPMLAKALGKTEPAIMAMISKSQIGRKEIAALFQTMKKEGAGAAAKFSRSWEGLTSTLSDNWAMLKNRIMEGGPFDWLKDKLAQLNQWLERLQADPARLEAIGQSLRRGFEAAEAAVVRWWAKMEQVVNWMGGWENTLIAALVGVAAVITGPLILAITQLGLALTALASHPIMAALIGLALLIQQVYQHWDQLTAAVGEVGNAFTQAYGLIMGNLIQALTALAIWIQNNIDAWDRFVNQFMMLTMPGWINSLQGWLEGIAAKFDWLGNKWQAFKNLFSGWQLPSFGWGGGAPPAPPAAGGLQKQSAPTPAPAPAAQQVVFRPLAPGGPQKMDTGGTLRVKIDSAAPVRVVAAQTNNPRQRISVDTGPLMVPV